MPRRPLKTLGKPACRQASRTIDNRKSTILLAVVLLAASLAGAQEQLPFAAALDAAAVAQDRLDSILDNAVLVGNGDINALLYTEGGNVVMMLTKNDVWDARLDAKLNPPLPTLARLKELAAGEWPNRDWILPAGLAWKPPDSYHAHAYPCPRACARLVLGYGPAKPLWRQIRAQGRRNEFKAADGLAVMSLEGQKGDSCGYSFGPIGASTADYDTVHLKLSGTPNAQFYVDVMAPEGGIMGSGWKPTPAQTEERTFKLPPGRRIDRVILYTWTTDGKRAENRYASLELAGPKGRRAIDLSVLDAPSSPCRLDIRRAAAHVAGAAGGPPKTDLRALAQSNVFLIGTGAQATLEALKSADLPPAATGITQGVRWIRQQIPGDEDLPAGSAGWPGMSFTVALAEGDRRLAVAIVTSREAKDDQAAAIALARAVDNQGVGEQVRTHEQQWQRFWAASGVRLDDQALQDAWYRNLYFLRCVSKPGVVSPGLFASLINDHPAWHGDYHTNYNIQQTFWGCYAANHCDLAEPYDRLVAEYLPRAQWLAGQVYAMKGAYYPHVLFAYEPPDPARCKLPYGRQYIHHVWGMTIGVTGFTVQNLWWRYKYQPDRDWLEKIVYPPLRESAVFYADFIDQCAAAEGGKDKVVLAPSVSPEHWGWTPRFERNRDCAFDIAMAQWTLRSAIEAAGILKRDAELARRFTKALGRLGDYPTTPGDQPVVVDVAGAPPMHYNIAVPAVPVFPGDQVTWFSSDQQKKLFARTIDKLQWNGNNSAVILAVCRARLSMPNTWQWVRQEIQARLRPNGTLTLNRLGHHFNNFGHYTEQFGATMAVSELLIQSVDDVIRVFPAWPADKPAAFENLRAQGGFLVSSELADKKVRHVTILSTVGGKLRLVSPWLAGLSARREGEPGSQALKADARGIIELGTRPGERLVFQGE